MRRMRWLPALGWCLVLTSFGANRCLAQQRSPYPNDPVAPSSLGSQSGLTPAAAAPTVGDPYLGIRITPQAGAWSICIATFPGDEAPEFAHQMVAYIRNKYHVPAYAYDRADQQRRKENDDQRAYAQLHPGYRPHYTRVDENCAILVGGFSKVEEANAFLKEVHKWPTPDIRLPSGLPPFTTRFEMVLDKKGDSVMENGKPKHTTIMLNPCVTAFAIRNPATPEGQSTNIQKSDPAWHKINSEEEFSIFKCPKPWTMAVAQYNLFTVASMRQESNSVTDKWWNFAHKGDGLDTAAISAHNLAQVLRHAPLNMEAYVLHTRTSSVVTIGSFDNGNFKDPNYESARQQVRIVRQELEKTAKAKNMAAPPFFNTPLPMEVPR